MGKYEHYKQLWEEDRKIYPPHRGSTRSSHVITGKDLIQELRVLKRITGDRKFETAIAALHEHGLVDGEGRWIRHWKPPSAVETELIFARAVDGAISRGKSIREACAWIALDFSLENHSFEGAVEYLERVWKRHKGSPPDAE